MYTHDNINKYVIRSRKFKDITILYEIILCSCITDVERATKSLQLLPYCKYGNN